MPSAHPSSLQRLVFASFILGLVSVATVWFAARQPQPLRTSAPAAAPQAFPAPPLADPGTTATSNREDAAAVPREQLACTEHGRLERIHGYHVMTLDGTPEEMGRAAGRLVGALVRRVLQALIRDGLGRDAAVYANLLASSARMESYQPAAYRAELAALADSAGVRYEDLLLLQYHGDVRRCMTGPGADRLCTSFAVLPPNTRENTCLVGRNLDYFDEGVSEYATILIHYRPAGKIPFVTVTWTGIINGWTLLNLRGIFASNNTAYGAEHESLEGISTCFLLRMIAEEASTVAQGIAIVERGPRACGTNLLIASGNPPDAALIEFDHRAVAVRRPIAGFVGAANSYQMLYASAPDPDSPRLGRCGEAYRLVQENRGEVDFSMNIAGAEGVPIPSMNLHCATVDLAPRRLRLSMGTIPAYRLPFKAFRLTEQGLVGEPSP